jgi:hypothetical protein
LHAVTGTRPDRDTAFPDAKSAKPKLAQNSGHFGMRNRGNNPLYYCGSDNPTDEMVDRAVKFFKLAYEKNAAIGRRGFRVPTHAAGGKMYDPASTHDGLGKLWLQCFRDFRGDECISYPFKTGYHPRGVLRYNFKSMESHRVMCLMTHGTPKEEGKTMALHRCGNGHLACVNPLHLYWGDQSDNNRDARRHAVEGKQAA